MPRFKSRPTLEERVSAYKARHSSIEEELGLTDLEAEETVEALLSHAYHLPNHSYCQDWWQYQTNNHPLFGICCYHPLHPLQWPMRVAALVGSVFMGLAITCLIYVAFVFTRSDYDQRYFEISINATRTGEEVWDDNVSNLSVTNGNIALWTLGAALHALYDNCIWALAAGQCCNCSCRPKGNGKQLSKRERARKYQSTRTFVVLLSVIVVVAITFFAVSLYMALSSDDEPGRQVVTVVNNVTTVIASVQRPGSEENDKLNDAIQTEQLLQIKTDDANDWEFAIAYAIELGLTYLLYYPLVGTLLFSGILTCGHCPVVGGRPYEMRMLEQQEQDQEQPRQVNSGRSLAKTSSNRPGFWDQFQDEEYSVCTRKSQASAPSRQKSARSINRSSPSSKSLTGNSSHHSTKSTTKPTSAAANKKDQESNLGRQKSARSVTHYPSSKSLKGNSSHHSAKVATKSPPTAVKTSTNTKTNQEKNDKGQGTTRSVNHHPSNKNLKGKSSHHSTKSTTKSPSTAVKNSSTTKKKTSNATAAARTTANAVKKSKKKKKTKAPTNPDDPDFWQDDIDWQDDP